MDPLKVIFLMFAFSLKTCRLQTENLAFRRPTRQVSTYKNLTSDNAVDGDYETFAVTGDFEKVGRVVAWWYVKLDRIYYVKMIQIETNYYYQYAGFTREILIYVSIDGDEYLKCISIGFLYDGVKLNCADGLYGNLVHITRYGGPRMDLLALCEVKIYGEIYLEKTNVAIKKMTSQSSTHLGHVSEMAVDGDVETCSIALSSAENSTLAWWQLDLNGTYEIEDIVIHYFPRRAYTDFLHGIIIYISKTSQNYEKRICSTYDRPRHWYKESKLEITCRKNSYGRFVTIVRVIRNAMLGLCEVFVHGALNLDTITLSYKRPTFQSGITFSSTSALAVDGKLETCARVYAPSNEMAWWRVALDNVYRISNVSIYCNPKLYDPQYMNNFKVFLSIDFDNDEEQLCATFDKEPNKEAYVNITCTNYVVGQYVTIKKYAGFNLQSFLLCEVYVYAEDLHKVCPDDGMKCESESICIPKENVCDRIRNCADGSDEINCACFPYQHKCKEGFCLHNNWLCDGTKDCPHGDDETHPSCLTCGSHEFKCFKNNICKDLTKRCDGNFDCPDHSDEFKCIELIGETVDNEIKLLNATFEGETNFSICSTNWTIEQSFRVCSHVGGAFYSDTSYVPLDTKQILIAKEKVAFRNSSLMSIFKKSEQCESKEFVRIRCPSYSESACGIRRIEENLTGPYVVNGDEAQLGAWPWYVQVIINGRVKCGGSIITYFWIVTAAHCLINITDMTSIVIKLGSVTWNDENAKSHLVYYYTIHPNYNQDTLANDIGMIRLRAPILYNQFIGPICIGNINLKMIMTRRYCVFAGFGRTDGDSQSSFHPNRMQQGRMNIMTTDECLRNLENLELGSVKDNITYSDVLCAGSLPTTFGINACTGDGGSPLVCKDEHGVWSQIGIASVPYSYKYLDTKACTISLFVKVSKHLDYINTNLKHL